MPLALVISSHVAASRVGGAAQATALAHLDIETMTVPTVLFGRHPGWGPPGGAAVAAETVEAMLGGVAANGLFAQVDLVLTGYFASAAQVAAAARAIAAVRAAGSARIVVDPVMGDVGKGLYVAAEVAEAIAADLAPAADLLAPNAWELEHLSGLSVQDPAQAVAAARSLHRPVLVSSVPAGDGIGVVYADADDAWLAAHPRFPAAPNGTGDILTAVFAAAQLQGLAPADALARAAGAVAELAAAAQPGAAPELALGAARPLLAAPSSLVRLERL